VKLNHKVTAPMLVRMVELKDGPGLDYTSIARLIGWEFGVPITANGVRYQVVRNGEGVRQ
jgi:hypothetical protein